MSPSCWACCSVIVFVGLIKRTGCGVFPLLLLLLLTVVVATLLAADVAPRPTAFTNLMFVLGSSELKPLPADEVTVKINCCCCCCC